MAVNYALYRSQPYACSAKGHRIIEALEWIENLIYIFHIEPSPIVANIIDRLRILLHDAKFNSCAFTFLREFPCIADQVL